MAGALLAGVAAGAQLLAGEVRSPGGWSYAAAALGCAHAAVLGAVTIAIGRRATAVAWAPALLWPLAGPAPAAAALAALVGALVLAQRLGARGRVLSAALAAGALAVFVGAASATPGDAARADTLAAHTARDVARGDAEDGRDGGANHKARGDDAR